MQTTPMKRNMWYSVFLMTLGHLFCDFYSNFLPALLPVAMANLGMSLTASGLLIMVLSFTSSILQPVFGYIMDKRNLNWMLLFTIPGSAVFICFSGLAPTKTILFLLVAAAGLSMSAFHPMASSMVGRLANNQNKGFALSLFIGGGNIGFAFAPAIVIYLIVHHGVGALPWLIPPSFLLAIAYYRLDLHQPALRVVPGAAAGAAGKWYKNRAVLNLNAVMALRSWPQVAIPMFLPVLLTAHGYAPTLAGGLLTVYLLGGAAGGFLGGYAGDKIGYKSTIAASLAFCVIPTYFLLSGTEITAAAWIAAALSGAALQCSSPPSLVMAQSILPNNAAMASGMMMGLSFGLGGVGAAVTGALGDHIGLPAALLWTLAPLCLSVALALFLPGRRQGERRPIIRKSVQL